MQLKGPQLKLGPRHKKLFAIAGAMALLVIFASFLLSLSGGGQEAQTPPAADPAAAAAPDQAQGSLTPPTQQVPAAERFDYANLLNQPENVPAAGAEGNPENAALGTQGTLPAPGSDPFAAVRNPQTEPEAGSEPAPEAAQPAAPQPGDGSAEILTANPAPHPAVTTPAAPQAVLYCDNFSTANEAESRKAQIAFQGLSSAVTAKDGGYTLAVGPFPDREAARKAFAMLADKGLAQQCSLTDAK